MVNLIICSPSMQRANRPFHLLLLCCLLQATPSACQVCHHRKIDLDGLPTFLLPLSQALLSALTTTTYILFSADLGGQFRAAPSPQPDECQLIMREAFKGSCQLQEASMQTAVTHLLQALAAVSRAPY